MNIISMIPRFLLFKNFFSKFSEKTKFFEKFFLIVFLFLFLGLFFGSLFGTFLDLPRSLGIWDGFIILFLIFSCEIINLLVYSYKLKSIKILNYFKLGILLALFIDAFKVGS